jgi:hypothetical protein
MELLCKIGCNANPLAAGARLFLCPLLAIAGFACLFTASLTPAWDFGLIGAALFVMMFTSPDWNNHMHFPGAPDKS